MNQPARPQTLSVLHASAIVVGIVVGIGIFKTPAIVAANSSGEAGFLALWVLGGLLTLIGALCYSELASAHPNAGGEYHYLTRAYGQGLGFLFAWARMSVIQTGAIAAVAFVYGDYAALLIPLGEAGAAIHAAIAIAVLSGIQLLGTTLSGRTQLALTVATVAAVVMVAAIGFAAERAPATAEPTLTGTGAAGLAMIFILLTYGGWNEASYLSGEVRDVKRNMPRVLLIGTGIVMALYLLVNISFLWALGLDGLRQAQAVAAEPVRQVLGDGGAALVSLFVCASALSTLNGTIFTGARSMFALGQSFAPFAALGYRNANNGAPTTAIFVQAAIALGLVAFGAMARDGFQAMVEYTAPVFWMFLLLVGISLFLFRWREPEKHIPFRVPLYPLTPLVFCGTSLYLLYSSLVYTGSGALFGLAVLAAGVPVFLLGRQIQRAVPVRSSL